MNKKTEIVDHAFDNLEVAYKVQNLLNKNGVAYKDVEEILQLVIELNEREKVRRVFCKEEFGIDYDVENLDEQVVEGVDIKKAIDSVKVLCALGNI